MKAPKTHASIRQLALDDATLDALVELRRNQKRLAMDCDVALPDDGFLFSTAVDASVPPHPDAVGHASTGCERRQRYLQTSTCIPCVTFTPLPSTPSYPRPRSRLGWAGPRCRWPATTRTAWPPKIAGRRTHRPSSRGGAVEGVQGVEKAGLRRFLVGGRINAVDEPLHRAAGDPETSADGVYGKRERAPLYGPVEGGAGLA